MEVCSRPALHVNHGLINKLREARPPQIYLTVYSPVFARLMLRFATGFSPPSDGSWSAVDTLGDSPSSAPAGLNFAVEVSAITASYRGTLDDAAHGTKPLATLLG